MFKQATLTTTIDLRFARNAQSELCRDERCRDDDEAVTQHHKDAGDELTERRDRRNVTEADG